MTLDELVIEVRVAAEDTQSELDAVAEQIQAFAGKTKSAKESEASAWQTSAASAVSAIAAVQGALLQMQGVKSLEEALMAQVAAREALGEAWDDDLVWRISQFLGAVTSEDQSTQWMESFVSGLMDVLASEDMEALESFRAALLAGILPTQEEFEGAKESLSGLTEMLTSAFEEAGLEDASAMAQEAMASLMPPEALVDGYADLSKVFQKDLIGALEEAEKEGKTFEKQLSALDKTASDLKSWKNAISTYQDTGEGMEDVQRIAQKFGQSFDGSADSIKANEAAIASYAGTMGQDLMGIQSEISGLESAIASAQNGAVIYGNATMDVSQAMERLSVLKAMASAVLSVLSFLGFAGSSSGGSSGGGGGGGSNKEEEAKRAAQEARRAAEEAARKAEEARKEAIQNDYDLIDHKRNMNEITLEEELALLEKIATAHRLNAEEIMAWEEKVYDLQQEIRERNESAVENLANGVMDALGDRYDALLSDEITRLDESRAAWEAWREKSVSAIEDQIQALDELSKAEDKEALDAAELRNIAKLESSIDYEQDDYNRLQLQAQLDQAISDRENRLLDLEREAQKEALQAQIDAVQSKADAAQDALSKEQEAIEAHYENLTQEAQLRAEAEKLLLQGNQDELLALLSTYESDYNAMGQSLGEKLVDGFTAKVGDIVSWFEGFNDTLASLQQSALSAAMQGTAAFESTLQTSAAKAPIHIEYTNAFNQPIESPYDVQKRIEEANEALGELL